MVVTKHTTYTDMGEVKKAVLAGEINVGDCISVTLGGKPALFDVIGLDVDDLAETGYQHSVTIQAHDLLEERPFDETDTWGSNVWETSDIRAYLNSKFKARVPALTPYLGTAKKINSNGSITEDRFFLLSKDEYDPDVTPYPYYRNQRNRVKFDPDGYADWHWTRSAGRSNAYSAWYVNSSGGVYSSGASGAFRFAPACVLIF
ncbi:MAG: DUF1566 domain-containing protein [Clostridiales bacterium]|nr:DUF1566 domain-containing protein [Clostridiales bacterium]